MVWRSCWGGISCVVYNPARVAADTLFEVGEERMVEDFKVSFVSPSVLGN